MRAAYGRGGYGGRGDLSDRSYGTGTLTRHYIEDHETRLTDIETGSGGATANLQHDVYGYDGASDVTAVADVVAGQVQCFGYDPARRLAHAYTLAGSSVAACSGSSGSDQTGGGDHPAYDLGYRYDGDGDITAATDTLTTTTTPYGYSAGGHQLTTAGADSFGYNQDGEQTARTVGGVATTLAWEPALGQLTATTTGSATTSYVYAADGTRLLREDPDGSATLYLPGEELHRSPAGTITATRSYTDGAAVVAQRSTDPGHGGLWWLAADAQGSQALAVDPAGAVTRQRYLPYGALRTTASLPTSRGFLDQPLDPSGLLADGARYYDPTLGTFISPDPVTTDTYAADNAETLTDPTGLMAEWGEGVEMDGCLTVCGRGQRFGTVSGGVQAVVNNVPHPAARDGNLGHAVADLVAGAGQGAVNMATTAISPLGPLAIFLPKKISRYLTPPQLHYCPYSDNGGVACEVGQLAPTVGLAVTGDPEALLGDLPEGAAGARLAARVAEDAEPALPKLTGTIAGSFEGGAYTTRTFKAGTIFYRAERSGQGIGSFFGMVKPESAAEAEKLFNIAKWGNSADVVGTYRLDSDTTMYVGRVAGGEGMQALVPRGSDLGSLFEMLDQEPLP